MAVHLIVLLSPADAPQTRKVAQQIEQQYPGFYPMADGLAYLVQSPDVAEVIKRKIGLAEQQEQDSRKQATGLVVKMNGSYSGYAARSMWDWLEEANV